MPHALTDRIAADPLSGSPTDALTILLAGVGGQGVLLAGEVVADAAFQAGLEVKTSEVHGLSRRFGSVSCQVRLGRVALSPLRGHGGVDILVAMEANEGLRHLPYLKADGVAIVNRLWIACGAATAGKPAPGRDGTLPVANGIAPAQPRANDQAHPTPAGGPRIVWLEGTDTTHEWNCPKSLNMYMVGALSCLLPIPHAQWPDALRRLPEKHFRINRRMFQAGRDDLRGAEAENGLPSG